MKTGELVLHRPHRTNPRRAILLVELGDDLYELKVHGSRVESVLITNGGVPVFEPCPVAQADIDRAHEERRDRKP